MARPEPWRRLESKVDPENALSPAERQRRAKIAYRAFLRRAVKKGVQTRAAKKRRQEAALQRQLANPMTQAEHDEWQRERREYVRVVTIILAAERGYNGVLKLMDRQAKERSRCFLCDRPFEPAGSGAFDTTP